MMSCPGKVSGFGAARRSWRRVRFFKNYSIAGSAGPSGKGRCIASFGRRRHPSEQVELVVGAHIDQMRHAVRQCEKGGDAANVPDVLVAEAVALQDVMVLVRHCLG